MISPRFELTFTPPPTGTREVFVISSPDAELDGVGVGAVVAAGANVASRKPLVTLSGTTCNDFAVGPLIRRPVLALKTLLSFGQVTRANLTCDASRFDASCGQLAMKPEYREVLCLKTRMRLPAIVKTLAAPTLMSAALPRLMSFACAGWPVSKRVARAKEPPMSSLLFKPLPLA
jgi:hypothetical protein